MDRILAPLLLTVVTLCGLLYLYLSNVKLASVALETAHVPFTAHFVYLTKGLRTAISVGGHLIVDVELLYSELSKSIIPATISAIPVVGPDLQEIFESVTHIRLYLLVAVLGTFFMCIMLINAVVELRARDGYFPLGERPTLTVPSVTSASLVSIGLLAGSCAYYGYTAFVVKTHLDHIVKLVSNEGGEVGMDVNFRVAFGGWVLLVIQVTSLLCTLLLTILGSHAKPVLKNKIVASSVEANMNVTDA